MEHRTLLSWLTGGCQFQRRTSPPRAPRRLLRHLLRVEELEQRVVPVATLLFVVARGQLWEMFVIMGLAGLGVGCTFAALPGLIVRSVPPEETGSAMSFNQVLRYVGYAVGSALSATILAASQAAEAEGGGGNNFLIPNGTFFVILIIFFIQSVVIQ